MSSLKLKHSSGNGTLINAPASNPSADITLKVPSTTGSAGQVLKVASANHSSTNAELEFGGPPRPYRNLIINGAMNVAQRGTSTTTDAAFALDRWKHSSNGLGVTITNSQQSLTSSDTPYSYGFRKSNRLALASAGTAGAAHFLEFLYTAEAQDIANSGWDYTSTSSYVTISFWARASSTQTYGCVFETNDGTAYLYPKTFALTANTWTKVSFSVPGNSNLTVNNDTGAGLLIKVFPYLGTTYSGGTDATWAAASGNGYGSMGNTSTWLAAGASTFDLTGVQLEVGDTATTFEHTSYGDELAKCQRYCNVFPSSNQGYGAVVTGYCVGSTLCQGALTFPDMRAAPTASVTGNFRILHEGSATALSALDGVNLSANSALVRFYVSSGLTTGNAGMLTANNDTSAKYILSAEL